MEMDKEYIMNSSQDEADKLEKAVACINEFANAYDGALCSVDPNEWPSVLRALDDYFNRALDAFYDFVHEYYEN